MKAFSFLLILLLAASEVSSYRYYSLADTFQSVLDTENALEEELKVNFENARAARQKHREEAQKKLNETLSVVAEAVKQKADELKQEKEVLCSLNALWHRFLFQEEAAKRKEQAGAAIAEWKEVSEQVGQFVEDLKEKKQAKEQERKQVCLVHQLKCFYDSILENWRLCQKCDR